MARRPAVDAGARVADFGLYSGFVYFTPLLGGMIADRWIGQRNAVVIGALSHERRTRRHDIRSGRSCSPCCCSSSARASSRATFRRRSAPCIRARTKLGEPAASSSSARESTSEPSPVRWSADCSRKSIAGTMASASPRSSCSSAWRPISTDTGICQPGWSGARREGSPHPCRAAHRRRARRRDHHHDLPVGGLLTGLQCDADMDQQHVAPTSAASGSRALVPIDRSGVQHPGRAAAVLDLAAGRPSGGANPTISPRSAPAPGSPRRAI